MDTTTTTMMTDLLVQWDIPKTHATVGWANMVATQKDYRTLLLNRRLPDRGWSDLQIQHFLLTLSTLDTNPPQALQQSQTHSQHQQTQTPRWCGVGEREGRVYSSLVAARHYGLAHGIGRSGDIAEAQPKAVGSSLLAQLTLTLTLDVIRRGGSGLHPQSAAANGIVLPLCTGMSMALVLAALREASNPPISSSSSPFKTPPSQQPPTKDIVLWSRIDQKSCFKAIQSAGLKCVVIPTTIHGDQVVTDLVALEHALSTTYRNRVLAVITTTSCFAPRVPDKVDRVAQLCQTHDTAHVLNHAYGLQCSQTGKLINRACTIGRVDAIVCSTDKNFLVPVGGAVVLSPQADMVQRIGKVYAGRASAAPLVDLLITLLAMGLQGYQHLHQRRLELVNQYFADKLTAVAHKYGERVLQCPDNTISFGITLDSLGTTTSSTDGGKAASTSTSAGDDEETHKGIADHAANTTSAATTSSSTKPIVLSASEMTSFGAMLFSRCVSGTRVVPRGVDKTIGGHRFEGFGSSTDDFPHSYMTAACAMGVEEAEIDEFCKRLDKTLKDYKKKLSRKKQTASAASAVETS